MNSFEDWYFNDTFTPAGKWMANFRSISDVEADEKNIFCMREDGSWARFKSEDGTEKFRMKPFRGYLDATEFSEEPSSSRKQAAPLPGTYRTMFQTTDQQGTATGENVSFENLDFEPIIPFIDGGTGIQPTFRVIDTDGTNLYFDLQGRMLNGKSLNGLYIEKQGTDAKKVLKR